MIRIYNTRSRKEEAFTPLLAGEVRMYVCGVTPYDVSHIGHARSAMAFDVIRRYLIFRGYRVRFVRNYTDVDDKIIRRANQEGVPAREISERYIASDQADMAALGILPPDVAPKCTEHIPQMLRLIEGLVRRGLAYAVDGDVYFEVARFPSYGQLSGKNLDELLVGARVDVDERKRDPRDFALWKAAKPGEPTWASPWGPGRPGWHIECSAMAMEHLGETLDIHGGGEDLIFPHHECEIAQSEGVTDKPFARIWMHNGMVNLGAEKMSKSLGNTLAIGELVRRHDPEAIRLYVLGTHYRTPLEFSEDRVREAARSLERFRILFADADRLAAHGPPAPGSDQGFADEMAALRARFEAAMDEDFNTPEARAVLFDMASALHAYWRLVERRERPAGAFLRGVDELRTLGQSLGLFHQPTTRSITVGDTLAVGLSEASHLGIPAETRARADALAVERDEARRRRDWERADELRDELQALGATVEDTPGGTRLRWR